MIMEFLIFTVRVCGPTKIPMLLWNPKVTFVFHWTFGWWLLGLVILPDSWTGSQYDGVPMHFSITVWEHLHLTYRQSWAGRGGPVPWPARLPDLNLSVWIFPNISVHYTRKWPRGAAAMSRTRMPSNPSQREVFEFRRSFRRRCRGCSEMEGGHHFEQLI